MPEPLDIDETRSRCLRTARMLLDMGYPLDEVLQNPLVPPDMREWVSTTLSREENRTFEPAGQLVASPDRPDWLAGIDRSGWHYWPKLRSFLLGFKGWPIDTVRSLDESSDKVLRQLAPPDVPTFDIRGLVLGYVQSGKTANFTAVIAKAADAGYRLVIVLSGIDNGLRRQTQIRLDREIVGSTETSQAVALPPVGHRWHQFTTDAMNGDFHPGRVNHAALQGSQPVLLVVKKNGSVLRRLRTWLHDAPAEVRSTLPALFIDDESDQASVDVRGSYQQVGSMPEEGQEYEAPSVINGLIRELLSMFAKKAYVAYTATPFANILIPHDGIDPTVGADLYPKDFIIDLPKPYGYFGTEEFFGRLGTTSGESVAGLDVIRIIPEEEFAAAENDDELTATLTDALFAFILGGAARALRGKPDAPCTMLVHTSQSIANHQQTKALVDNAYKELRDAWRYDRGEIREKLACLWEHDFRRTTRNANETPDAPFGEIEPFIGPFFEAVVVREINSYTGEVLDYEREPKLKAIAIGGNRLARGLTLEGLLVSYFGRRTSTYDTLMQMGRWFGYRGGYQDLIRLYVTPTMAGWFADLAEVEFRLRQDLQVYENMGLRPDELGPRILMHPAMQVTSALKRRHSTTVQVSQTYAGKLGQTFKFPFSDENALAILSEQNRQVAIAFLKNLGRPSVDEIFGPLWNDVSAETIVDFLNKFEVDSAVNSVAPDLMAKYIERANSSGELVNWSVLVRGRNEQDTDLGAATWVPTEKPVWNLSRSRIKGTNSMGVITTSGDEAFGLSPEEMAEMKRKLTVKEEKDENRAARFSRSSACGLLILYPISKFSGYKDPAPGREPLYAEPTSGGARDLIGMAVSFPNSNQPQTVEAYLEGTSRWRPIA